MGKEASINAQLVANLGKVNLSGLPRLSFVIGQTHDLDKLGFAFMLTHSVIPIPDVYARTEWQITGLRTCVYLDADDNLIWVRPSMGELVLRKDKGYINVTTGWSACIANNGIDVRLTNRSRQEWHYMSGYLKSIADPNVGVVDFRTNHEVILQGIKRGTHGNDCIILKVDYTELGLLPTFVWVAG